jgi:DNA repair protein RadC
MNDRGLIERIRDGGVHSASVVDLVAIGFARREADVGVSELMARKMLQRFGSLKALCEAGAVDLEESTGLESFDILRSKALIELGRRCIERGRGQIETVDGPEDALRLLEYLRDEKREHFVAILLDAKNQLMRVAEIHIGTLSASLVGPREVFREAVRDGASAMIVGHNHPSGDPTPSPEDIQITKRLVEVGVLLDIPVLDHIIVGERYSKSLKGGLDLGRSVGRSNPGFARESTRYARSEGSGPWALS